MRQDQQAAGAGRDEGVPPGLEAPVGASPGGPSHRLRSRLWPRRRHRSTTGAVMAALLVPAVVLVGLLGFVVFLGFHVNGDPGGALTLSNYEAVFSDPAVWDVVLNTAIYVGVTLVVALGFGTTLALIVERTDFGWERTINATMVLRILIPGFFTAMGWVFLFQPRIGSVNKWLQDLFGFSSGPIDIISLPGMGFVEGLGLSAVVFIMVSNGLRSMDGSLEEAARASGASTLTVFRRVTLPLMLPSLLGSALFTATIAISSIDVPLIMGLAERIFVFSTYLYVSTNPAAGVTDYGIPAAFSSFMIVLALIFSLIYSRVLRGGGKYQVVAGKGYRPNKVPLGRWRPVAWLFVLSYFFWSTVAPLLIVAWMALQPFVKAPSWSALDTVTLNNFTSLDWDLVGRGVETTLKLMVLAPTLAVIVSLGFSFVITRSRSPLRFVYDFIAFMPQAVPQLIFAFSALIAALYWGESLYGSLILLVLVMALVQIAFGSRMFNAAMLQIHVELEEAAAMSGASVWAVWRRITLPLLRPVMTYTWLWLALLSFRELTFPVVLGSKDTLTVSVVSWTLYSSGQVGLSSALTLLMVLAMIPAVLLFLLFARKRSNGGGLL